MKKERPYALMVFTSWTSGEPLLVSYVLPYLRIIRNILPQETTIHLVTWEKAETGTQHSSAVFYSLAAQLQIQIVPVPFRKFGFRAAFTHARTIIRLLRIARRERITHLHAFAPPAGAMAMAIRTLHPAKFIMDSWEPHASAMVEAGVWKKHSLAFRTLWRFEQLIPRVADFLVAASPQMTTFAENHGIKVSGRVLVRPACTDTRVFDPDLFDKQELRRKQGIPNDAVVCICVSKLGGLYLGEEVFQFFARAHKHFGGAFRAIVLSSNTHEQLAGWAEKYLLPEDAMIHRQVSHLEVPRWLAMADFALNPQLSVPSKRFGTPVKDGEYWAMGLPVVIMPEISEDSELIVRARAGAILKSLTTIAMDRAVFIIDDILSQDEAPVARIRDLAETKRSMSIAEKVYTEIYGV